MAQIIIYPHHGKKTSKNYRPELNDIAPAVVKVMLQPQEYPMEKEQGKFVDFH